jgi:hypothetical protein
MLEQLLNSLKSEIGGNLTSQANLPSEQVDDVISAIGGVAHKEIAGQMTSGNLSHLMNLFSDKPNTAGANQIQSKIHSNVLSELTGKLGISPEISGKIAAVALPALIGMITRKNNTTPDDDPSPLTELFGGAGTGGLLGGVSKNLLGGLFGK